MKTVFVWIQFNVIFIMINTEKQIQRRYMLVVQMDYKTEVIKVLRLHNKDHCIVAPKFNLKDFGSHVLNFNHILSFLFQPGVGEKALL